MLPGRGQRHGAPMNDGSRGGAHGIYGLSVTYRGLKNMTVIAA